MNFISAVFTSFPALLAVFLVARVGKTSALRCYVCTSTVSSKCADSGFDGSALTITDNCNQCQTTVVTSTVLSAVTRACSAACSPVSGGVAGLGGTTTTCCSDKDLCNAPGGGPGGPGSPGQPAGHKPCNGSTFVVTSSNMASILLVAALAFLALNRPL